MPRKAKGANPAKPNRTDMTARPSYPAPSESVPTGQPYGTHQQLQAQAQLSPPADPLRAALDKLTSPDGPTLAAVGMDGPTMFGDLPPTAGLPVGPGPGPEVLGIAPRRDVADTLLRLAGITGDPTLLALAQRAAAENL